MQYILKTDNLTKVYGNQVCVDNLCINIERGDIYGFLGQNGAGKTTTLKMILGLIPMTSGAINLFGKNVDTNDFSYLRKIGSIIEFPSFYEDLTAFKNLKLHENYLGLNDNERIEDSLNKLKLLDAKDKKVREFSLGMKQRLGIARAILHNPDLLILDEPTNGLDPLGIKELRNFILDLALKHKITLIISSHILSEIELIATKVGIINKGKMIKEIRMESFNDDRDNCVQIKVNNGKKAEQVLKKYLSLNSTFIDNNCLRVNLKKQDISTCNISKILVDNNLDLFEITRTKETLEDYFVKISGGIHI